MQTLDIISVNLWQILISLFNLVLLFLIIKRFLFKPVKSVLDKREAELRLQYAEAEAAAASANESKRLWEEKLSGADKQASDIIENAAVTAKYRGEKIVEEAQLRADSLIRVAKSEAELAHRRAADEIKREIVVVSEALAEKMLEREINTADHRELIDSFIEKIGDAHE